MANDMGDKEELMEEAGSLDFLPNEMLVEILKNLGDDDLRRVARTNRRLRIWAKDVLATRERQRARLFWGHVNDFIERARQNHPDDSEDDGPDNGEWD